MKTIGIIAEYNPFHNGHLYQLQKLRAQTGADFIIAAISGDFVQRGKPAIYGKHTRTRMALSAGVDLVLELPVCFATGSAEDFASCGVALLDRLGVVDMLGFGSESGDCRELSRAAAILEKEPEDYSCRLRACLRQGMSFPKARAAALEPYFPQQGMLLSAPNNILAIEYLRALKRRQSSVTPVAIRRTGQGYHDTGPAGRDIAASASAIRKAIRENDFSLAKAQVPPAVSGLLAGQVPIFSDDLTALLNARLMELSCSGQEKAFAGYADMSPELASRLARHLLDWSTFSGRVMQLKSRTYTYTRISRALLHLLLGITQNQTLHYKGLDYVCYARILGFRRQAAPLLKEIKLRSSLPLVTKTADAHKILDADGLAMLEMDFYASHLYQSVVFSKSGQKQPNEYTSPVVII
ncbi:MAG: nucleotidyltransferase family protein [Lachnospiraceae bacterium]|nr:nucleotidyltransferase family protein [Lachnospiraceae bacterium]